MRDPRIRLRVWHRRGWFSPSWLSHPLGNLLWAISLVVSILIVVGPHLVSPAVRNWSLSHPLVVIAGIAIVVGIIGYWWWARRDASGREALRNIALHGRIAMPAGDLTPDDLAVNVRQVGPAPAFLPRRLRRCQDPTALESWATDEIPSLLHEDDLLGRRVALVGAAAMGKTRLVHELIQRLPPETIVFAPSRNLGDRSDADLRHATRYLGGKSCVLVFDDLNFYVGRTDAAELEQVVAKQASICSIAVTCTTSTLQQIRSDEEPALGRFFSSLDQYEILRMTDEQMEVLAAGPARRTREREPHDCGGNPGLLLLDFRRLRGEFDSLRHQEVAVLGAIHSLFVAGISPITVDQVRALASSGFGAVLDPPIVNGALKRLYSMSFVRERSPVVPEEAFLREVFEENAGWTRLDEVESVLHDLQDAIGLSQLGNTHYHREDFERASRVMRLVADQFRVAGTPESLVSAAKALYNRGIALADWGQPEQEVEAAYRDAVAAGREASTPAGWAITAKAFTNLVNVLAIWGRPEQEIEIACRDAAAAGREAATPEGLEETAKALCNLGVLHTLWGRPEQEIEATYRDAAAAGREAATPEGLVETARALFALGNALVGWGRPEQEVEAAYRDAAAVGREAAVPAGLALTARALSALGNGLVGWEREPEKVEAAYRDAAAAGREAAVPAGLVLAAKAQFNLGNVLVGWERVPEKVETAYRDAAAAGREAATSEGSVETARALYNLGHALAGWGRPEQEVEAAYRDAAAAGREVATPEGSVETARALFALGNALAGWGRPEQEVEAAYREAAAAGRGAAVPAGLVLTAQVLSNLGIVFAGWGRPEQEVEAAYRDAAAAGREAAITEGLVDTARTLFNLGNAFASWGRPEQEIEAAYRDAAAAGRVAATPGGLLLSAWALFALGTVCTSWGRAPRETPRSHGAMRQRQDEMPGPRRG